MRKMPGAVLSSAAGLLAALVLHPALPAVTITEIHFDPPGESAGLEFVEVHNDSPTVADLSGWSFSEGIDFTFPGGTLVPGRGYSVVCANEAVFGAAYPGVTPAGTFTGKLDSDGESLVLLNNGGGEVVRVRYGNRGKWPSIPAGTGYTLSLLRPHLDPGEPESWRASSEPGGTPGAANFSSGGFDDVVVVGLGPGWRYRKGTTEFSTPRAAWRAADFTPGADWLAGSSGFGYGDGDDATTLDDMQNGYISVAARRTFSMSQAVIDSIDSLILAVNYDDGFVAYLNGTEVARAGLPGNPGDEVQFNAAAVSHEAGLEEEFEVPKSILVPGQNVLAIQGHNTAIESSDLSLAPRLLRRKAGDIPGGTDLEVAFNEFFGRAAGSRWVELYNMGAGPADLSEHFLSDAAAALNRHALPAGTSVPPGGFLVVTESESGLDFSTPEVRLFLTGPDRISVLAAEVFERTPSDGLAAARDGYSDARVPDGTGELGYASDPTPGAPNIISVSTDIVINEIFYNPPDGNTGGEFIELHNRGSAAVDLGGWAFTKGVSFVFPSVVIPPGGYAVIASDPAALEAAHSAEGFLGPWTGSLANSGENIRLVDSAGNRADEVRYADGGSWSHWADGDGSSLELVDSRQDNSFPSAWEASDESAKSSWKEITYTGSYGPEAASELHVLLIDAGVVLLDDVSLKRSGSPTEYIPNGGFESGTNPWLFQGTHEAGRRTTADAYSGAACLELNASGGGDNGVNKIETDTSPSMPAGTYTVSFRAKWIRGKDKILTRADSSSGASLSRVSQLAVPSALGTPGLENSARAALRAVVPGGNLGPVIGGIVQSPVVPGAASPVTIKASAHDADGITSLVIHYRQGGLGNGVFTAASMFDDGAHQDSNALDGLYAGVIPPFPQGTRIVFYLEGTDALGEPRRFPVEAPSRTLLYSVEARSATSLFTVRLGLDAESDAALRSRLLHSDDLLDGTFVFNDEEIYYNVGVRYHGSPWNRPPDPKMFRVRFNEDKPFMHGLRAVNLSRYGTSQNEGASYFCVQSASTPSSPGPVGDYFYSQVYLNGAYHGKMAIVETIDSRYVEKWFPGDGDGYIFKIPGRRYFDDSGSMSGVDWTTFGYRGSNSNFEYERYRWYFNPGSRQNENRWADLVALCTTMDVSRTTPAAFDAQIESILDVEQFLRVEAVRTLQDDWDTIGIGNGQNAYVYFAPGEGRWKLLPWDMDHTFGNVGAKLFPEGSEAQITRLVQRPQYRRMYLRILEELLETAWNPAYIGPYLSQTQSVMGADGGGILSFINARRPSIAALLPAPGSFRATRIGTRVLQPDWDGVHNTARSTERLTGSGPLRMETLATLRGEEQLDLPVTWTTTTWSINLPIGPGDNHFEVLAFDREGDLAGSIAFVVTSTAGWLPPAVEGVAPASGPASGGTRVLITGTGFQAGARAFFGGVESPESAFISGTELEAVTPPGIADMAVVGVRNADGQTGEKAAAFEYVAEISFVRGDVNLDGQIDLSDGLRTLFFLFAGAELGCRDAADVQNDGLLNLADVIATLEYLFRGGPAPAAPFPEPGTDPAAPEDALECTRGV